MKSFWTKFISLCAAAALTLVCLPPSAVLATEATDQITGEVSDTAGETTAQEGAADSASTETVDTSALAADTESDAAATQAEDSSLWPAGPEVLAESAVLMDAATGDILYQKNMDQQMYPASITKIMTCLLALENSSLDDTVVFSYDAVYKNETDSSHIARDVDEEMSMEDTLYAVMLESANECAYAVAEHVGDGDYQTFIDMMNERAVELGCTNTHFTNANGLPDEEHVTTAHDMALIAREAIKNDTFREIIGTTLYVIPPTNKHDEETYLNNHNRMINNYKGDEHLYEYCIGGKTGYTQAAGNTLVTYAEKGDQLLICVVLQTSAAYDDSIALFEYGFNDFQSLNIAKNETRFGDASGTGDGIMTFDGVEVYAELDPEAEVVLPDGVSLSAATAELSTDTASGDVLGTLTYTYGGRTVGSADILSTIAEAQTLTPEEESEVTEADTVANNSASSVRTSGERRMGRGARIALIVIIIVVVILIFFLIATRRARRRRRRKKQKAGSHASKGSGSKNSRSKGSSSKSSSAKSSASKSSSAKSSGSKNSRSKGSSSKSGRSKSSSSANRKRK